MSEEAKPMPAWKVKQLEQKKKMQEAHEAELRKREQKFQSEMAKKGIETSADFVGQDKAQTAAGKLEPPQKPTATATSTSSAKSSPGRGSNGKQSVKDRWMSGFSAAEEQKLDNYKSLDETRSKCAQVWLNKEIMKLIRELRRRGKPATEEVILPFKDKKSNLANKKYVVFRPFFDETANIFEAVAGTLKAAKSRNIVWYDAEDPLFQDRDGDVLVFLMKDRLQMKKGDITFTTHPLIKLMRKDSVDRGLTVIPARDLELAEELETKRKKLEAMLENFVAEGVGEVVET
eukprot:TRINITY_DN5003_c0_g1_i1.p1 TRINITY_DN5003_c0_g1~~TRINITY_DN5003_c0_g1_i1.p1  ORF type:complete len:306 (-),score=83.89 TRINITY_DN5003_c0_g1_i1:868-1734(-)